MAKQFRSRKNLNAAQRAETAVGNTGIFSIPKGTFRTTGSGPQGRLRLRQPVVKDSAPNPSRELSEDAAKTNDGATSGINPFDTVADALREGRNR